MITTTKEQIFSVLYDYMIASGGDGDATLACTNWKEAADWFETWLKENHSDFLVRKNNEDSVVFSGGQECIIITDFNVSYPSWADCVIRVTKL